MGKTPNREMLSASTVTRWVSFLILLAAVIFAAAMFFRVIAGFILPLFLAAVLVVMFRPLHRWVLEECKGRDYLAASISTTLILLIVLVPAIGLSVNAVVEAYSLTSRAGNANVMRKLAGFRERMGLDLRYGGDGLDDDAEPPARADELRRLEVILDELSNLSQTNPTVPLGEEFQARAAERLKNFRETLLTLQNDIPYENAFEIPQPPATEGENAPESDAEPPPEETPPPIVAEARQLKASLDGLLNEDDQLQATSPGAFRLALNDLRLNYQAFKETFLGGPLWAWLKEWANPTEIQLDQLRSAMLNGLQNWWQPLALGTGQVLGKIMLGLVVITVSLFFFLADGPALLQAAMRLSPMDDRYEQELLNEFERVSRAVVSATLLSAFAQGILAGIGFFFAGLNGLFLLTVLTMLLAMVPFVGAAAVWFPCGLWVMFYEERILAGLLLLAYGAGVVSTIDNVIKTFILHGQSNLHPLLALLSVLGGIQALGPIGVFVGPMVVAFFQALLNILHTELQSMEGRKTDGPPVPANDQRETRQEGDHSG